MAFGSVMVANSAECSSDDEDAFESMDPKAIDKKPKSDVMILDFDRKNMRS